MLRVDGRVLAGSVALVFLVGAGIGFAVAGNVGGSSGDAGSTPGPSTPAPEPASAGTAAVTPTATVLATASPAATSTRTGTVTTPSPMPPTSVPTATGTPGSTTSPTATPAATRTPMLIRRFEATKIESAVRKLVNEWREEQGLAPFALPEGRLVADLNAMARSHSVAMADTGTVAHTVDNRSSTDRYHEFDLYWNCRFKRANHDYIVTPDRNRLEVLARTYAGRSYAAGGGVTDYNANETAVARDIVEAWTSDPTFRERLSYRNVTRIGVGVETTRDNEVYVTGNLCGV
jgi:uncharacterized protein YkwD